MQKEALGILEGVSDFTKEIYRGKDFYVGNRGGKKVVLALAGIGKVNCAYATTLMLEKYSPDCVINTGIAGGVGKLEPLTALAVSSVCQHDSDTTALGDPIGLISGLNIVYFNSDEHLCELIKSSAKNAVTGRVATGDTFIASTTKAQEISKTFDAIACDMECGACAQICHIAGVPFGALKVISDSASDGAEMDYATLAERACQINASTMLSLIDKI